ncbi:MAG: outer membrane lipoprotein-sorting protein [Rhodobacteraceae bacterium]|nr:outer membrane lipoprotein-sorting protein [Paracoccaceae bacterium]
MAHSKRSFLFASLLAVISVLMPSVGVTQSARAIMDRVDANALNQNNSVFSVVQIATCKYGISGGKIRCTARATVKSLESASINTGPGGKDSQSIAFILEPASERGIGMLSYTYDNNKPNETWLYLSALGKVKRIVSSNSSNSEPVSLFGSEFTTEDQETGKLDDYTYALLKTITFKGRKTYVIEQIPTPARARQSRYARTVLWIDADRYVNVKAEMYDSRGKEIRRVIADNVERVNGVWLARSVTIMNLVTNRLSNMKLQSLYFGVSINAALLTQRALTDTAFRERHLDALRAQAN